MKALCLLIITCIIAAGNLSAQDVRWQPFGDGVYGGSIAHLARAEGEPIFAASEKLLFRSLDTGKVWERLETPEELNLIWDMATSPGGAVIVAANPGLVLRLPDGGTHWDVNNLPFAIQGNLAFVGGQAFVGTRDSLVLVSADDGLSWAPMESPLPGRHVRKIVATDDRTVLVTTNYGEVDPYPGFYRTTDQGASWSSVDTLLFGGHDVPTSLDVVRDGSVIACVGRDRCLRSDDSGETWRQLSVNDAERAFAIALDDGDLLRISGHQVYGSADAGETWELRSKLPTGSGVLDVLLLPSGEILLGVYNHGVLSSKDSGMSWNINKTGITATTVFDLERDSNGDLWVTTDDAGLLRSSDGGMSWIPDGFTADARVIAVKVVTGPNGEIFVTARNDSTHKVSLFRQRDETWEQLPECCTIRGLTFDATGTMLAAASEGLFRYSEPEMSWVHLSGYPSGLSSAVHAVNGDLLVTAGGVGTPTGVWRSSDGGTNWELMSSDRPWKSLSKILVRVDGTVLAGTVSRDGIFRSEDGGYTFTWVEGAPFFGEITDFVAAPSRVIFASGGRGVHRSADNGQTWEEVSAGIHGSDVHALLVDEAGHLLAGTLGEGLYRSLYPISMGTERDAVPVAARRNYPNPFSGRTTLEYELGNPASVRIAVIDVLGREVRVLEEGPRGAGRFAIEIDAAGLPSGIYFYRIDAEGISEVGQMLLVN